MNAIRALLFDVFGTALDWRGSLVREGRAWAARKGLEAAARATGLRTAFVRRPRELGHPSGYNFPHDSGFDLVADDFVHLADQLGA